MLLELINSVRVIVKRLYGFPFNDFRWRAKIYFVNVQSRLPALVPPREYLILFNFKSAIGHIVT